MYKLIKDVQERLSKVLISQEVIDMLWHNARARTHTHTHTHKARELYLKSSSNHRNAYHPGSTQFTKQSLNVFCVCIVILNDTSVRPETCNCWYVVVL